MANNKKKILATNQLEKVSKIFVPVETTDFIFAAYAYNFGFVGVLLILFLPFDELPENAFAYVGTIDEAIEKHKKSAA